MEKFRKAQVIMLTTENKLQNGLQPYLNLKNNRLSIPLSGAEARRLSQVSSYQSQHLYIISDDEIKEGDWCYNIVSKTIFQANREFIKLITDPNVLLTTNKKIIAATDRLSIDDTPRNAVGAMIGTEEMLPQLPQQFIEEYIESYNKGLILSDVLVEYEEKSSEDIQKELGIFGHDEGLLESEYKQYIKTNSIDKLKISPKDNTITIKKLKDSWNREEVSRKMKKSFDKGLDAESGQLPFGFDINKWINENL